MLARPVRQCARAASAIFLDASPFFRFGEAGQLLELLRYVGGKMQLTADVRSELERNATFEQYSWLRTLQAVPEYKHGAVAELAPDVRDEAIERIRASHDPKGDDHPAKHAGEITTVLAAREAQARGNDSVLAIVDDTDGKLLARECGVTYLVSALLSAEMVHYDAMQYEPGLAVYKRASGVGEREYRNALKRAPLLCEGAAPGQ